MKRKHRLPEVAGAAQAVGSTGKTLVILISGRGSNMEAVLGAKLPCRVAAVISNRADAGGLAVARERGIPLGELSQKRVPSAEDRDAAMRDFFLGHRVELIVDAGYDRAVEVAEERGSVGGLGQGADMSAFAPPPGSVAGGVRQRPS